ncbi:diguanylate cyclase domain-containing protein [Egicoccus sp. AB-alg2]|uniref:diguanylate cyclase domain-containing protein n=1 Tax=Egicoccus sp. AB-alg2 TaxID=3242693 RepID=UPI00359DD0B2
MTVTSGGAAAVTVTGGGRCARRSVAVADASDLAADGCLDVVGRPGAAAMTGERDGRDTAGITTRLVLAYVRRHGGEQAVHDVLALAGVPHTQAELEDERTWSTYETKVALFTAADAVLGDPDVGRHVGEALLDEQVGAALRLVIGALGSPQQVLRSVAKAQVKFSASATMHARDVGRGHGTVAYRLHPPRAPSRYDCDYTRGLLTQVTVLFGLPPARIEHRECQVAGADACVFEMAWNPRRRLGGRRAVDPAATFELAALREQVVDLQRTVADLVSSDDLDEVLGRIATRASAAVRAQRYLLAVDLPSEDAPRVIGDGFDPARAAELGRRLLAGADEVAGPERLTAEVTAAGVRYGWLAAELPEGEGFLPAEQDQLDAYAGLAATALTRARALADARARGARAEALLELAHGLAQEHTELGAARRVAEAIPTVVGAERSALLLWDETAACLRATAVHGFGDKTEALLALTVDVDDTPLVAEALRDWRPRVLAATDDDPWIRTTLTLFDAEVALAAPITVHGTYLGAVYACWTRRTGAPVGDEGTRRALSSLADQAGTAISGLRLLAEARHAATHDALTGLANRVLFASHLDQAIAGGVASRASADAVCFIDLDAFKGVNDRHGHAVGDELLVAVAARIRATVRAGDVVARLSGDEFGVLLRRLRTRQDAEVVAAALVDALAEPFALRTTEVRIGGSVGVAFVADGADAEDLLRRADEAMYAAKAERGTYRLAFDGCRT